MFWLSKTKAQENFHVAVRIVKPSTLYRIKLALKRWLQTNHFISELHAGAAIRGYSREKVFLEKGVLKKQ